MAYEYQTGEDPIDMRGIDEILPNELSGRYFQNLDAAMRRSEKTQFDRTLGDLSDRGFLRSGDTFTQVAEQNLGPSMERRNQVILPELQRAAGQGREERLQGVAFDRQKEMTAIQHKNKLEELAKQAEIQRMLMELEQSFAPQSGGFDWQGLAGSAIGGVVGAYTGGLGGGLGKGMADKALSGMFGKK